MRNLVNVIEKGGLEDKVCPGEVLEFLLTFLQEPFIRTTAGGDKVFDPGIVKSLSRAHSFARVKFKHIFDVLFLMLLRLFNFLLRVFYDR